MEGHCAVALQEAGVNCPKCNGERIEAWMCELQSMMDVCEYDMTCRNCGHEWRFEEGTMVIPTEMEQAEWANVTFVKKETDGILLPEPAKTWALNTLKEKP